MTLNGCAALGGWDFNLKVAISWKRCEIGPRLQLITNRKSYTGFDWHRKQWPWMTLRTKIEVFWPPQSEILFIYLRQTEQKLWQQIRCFDYGELEGTVHDEQRRQRPRPGNSNLWAPINRAISGCRSLSSLLDETRQTRRDRKSRIFVGILTLSHCSVYNLFVLLLTISLFPVVGRFRY